MSKSKQVRRRGGRPRKADGDRLTASITFQYQGEAIDRAQVREAIIDFLSRSQDALRAYSGRGRSHWLVLELESVHKQRREQPFDTCRRERWSAEKKRSMRVFMTPGLRQHLDDIAEAAGYPLGRLMRAAVAGDHFVVSDRREYSIDHNFLLREPRDVQTYFNVVRRRMPDESAAEFSERMRRVEHAREYLLRLFERSASVPQIERGCVIQTEGRQKVAIWMHDDEERRDAYSTMGRWMPRTWGRKNEKVGLSLTRSEKKHLDAIADMASPGEIGHVIHRAMQEYYIHLVSEREAEAIQRDRLNTDLYDWEEFQEIKAERKGRRQWIWMRE